MEKHRTGQSASQRAMRFEQAMGKKEIFVKLQIQEKCFLLSSLRVCQVLLLKYLQNYAVLVKHFFHGLPLLNIHLQQLALSYILLHYCFFDSFIIFSHASHASLASITRKLPVHLLSRIIASNKVNRDKGWN